jgi:hypothetical protein
MAQGADLSSSPSTQKKKVLYFVFSNQNRLEIETLIFKAALQIFMVRRFGVSRKVDICIVDVS